MNELFTKEFDSEEEDEDYVPDISKLYLCRRVGN
jgi:hypothetical protein